MTQRFSTICVLALLLAVGCGEKDLIDDSHSSEEQARSLVEQFQAAAEAGDDDAACELMSEELRSAVEGSTFVIDGEPQRVSCGVEAVLRLANPVAEVSTLPGAEVVSVAIDRHDEGAEVQLDNGTLLRLKRGGQNADGEWRIESTGYRPSPEDWEGQANPLTRSDPRAAAREVAECLRKAGFDARVFRTDPADTDAPDATVAFQRGTDKAEGGEVAIYEPGVEAIDKLEGLEESIEGFNGESEPRGRAGVIFFGRPKAPTREAVLACVR